MTVKTIHLKARGATESDCQGKKTAGQGTKMIRHRCFFNKTTPVLYRQQPSSLAFHSSLKALCAVVCLEERLKAKPSPSITIYLDSEECMCVCVSGSY